MAGCGSGPWGVSHASHKGAAEGTEDFVHKGRVCRPGLRLSVDCGLQLLAQRQRPDLVDREDWAQVGRSGGLCCPFALGDGFQLLPAVEVELPYVADHTLVCGQRHRAHRQRQWRAWPGCQVLAVPDTMAVRGSGGGSLSRGVGLSGKAVVAGSMESTASKLQWPSCGCEMIRTW